MALRIALENIESIAHKYDKCIIPILSLYANFYIRLFVKVFKNPKQCKGAIKHSSYVELLAIKMYKLSKFYCTSTSKKPP